MKAESGIRWHKTFSFFLLGLLCFFIFTSVPLNLVADGCFVIPKFVWDKHRDINEPTQKAIIVHGAGQEELILQVKYDGPLEEFGWLIPVPNLPTVKKGSMECFYELSKFTQKKMEPRWQYNSASLSKGAHGGEEEEPPVKVVEIKTVGAYDIAVLSTKNAVALENWLKTNQFALPDNATDVIDSYVKQGWYFIAVKINLKNGSLYSTAKQLAGGELNPLQVSFASERCVFPLKISSLNHTPSEVQVYVLSPEPLIEKKLFEKNLSANYQWRTNEMAMLAKNQKELHALHASVFGRSGITQSNLPPVYQDEVRELNSRSEINPEKLTPFAFVSRKDIPTCVSKIALLGEGKSWWLMKQTWNFRPEEMRDLEFEPVVSVLTTALADGEGGLAAANLMRLGTNGVSSLFAAMRNTNSTVRAHAASVAEEMFDSSTSVQGGWYPGRPMNPELIRLLPDLLNDSDPEVRLHAAYAAGNSASPIFFNRMLKLLRDDYWEISEAAQSYLKQQRDEMPKNILLFRQMLHDTNVNIQIAGIRLLMSIPNVEIPREELKPLFSVPRMEVAGVAVSYLKKENVSDEEANLLMHNSLWAARMMGLGILMMHANNQSVASAIPLLKDPVEIVRIRAHDMLTDLTGQNFPADQSEQWEKWWQQNKSTFTVNINPDELRKRQIERARQRREQNRLTQ